MPVYAETVKDLYDTLRAVTDHTRPAFDPEILACLNYGYQTTVRAIVSVRSQFLESYVDGLVIPAGSNGQAAEVDLSFIEPPLWRPTRMVLTGGSGQRAISFRYSSQVSQTSRGVESSNTGTFSTLYYDILSGRLPGKATQVTSWSPLIIEDPTLFPIGQRVQIDPPLEGGTFAAHYAVVVTATPGITLSPPLPTGFAVGAPRTARQIRSRVMRIANPGTSGYTGRLYYTYRPAKFKTLTDLLDPVVSEHSDIIVYYAISMYLRSVNDTEANGWFQNAQLLRSELMQDLEPLSNENSEHLDSDLWGWD